MSVNFDFLSTAVTNACLCVKC